MFFDQVKYFGHTNMEKFAAHLKRDFLLLESAHSHLEQTIETSKVKITRET